MYENIQMDVEEEPYAQLSEYYLTPENSFEDETIIPPSPILQRGFVREQNRILRMQMQMQNLESDEILFLDGEDEDENILSLFMDDDEQMEIDEEQMEIDKNNLTNLTIKLSLKEESKSAEKNECAICFENQCNTLTQCKHAFCSICIMKHTIYNKISSGCRCPLCRSQITEIEFCEANTFNLVSLLCCGQKKNNIRFIN